VDTTYLNARQLRDALQVRDLTNPAHGPHAMQVLLTDIVTALTHRWSIPDRWIRSSPLVAIEDNYDRLGFSRQAVTRDARYSRYVSPSVMLRSHTSAAMPPLLRSTDPRAQLDELVVVPGLVYRRDAIDRTHVGEPHQLDLWRLSSQARLDTDDLDEMLGLIAEAVLPGSDWRTVPTGHPYTIDGRQLDVLVDKEWLELGECGLVAPALLNESGLDARVWSGLAAGIGLDRALMLRKAIGDIRVLRSTDPRIESQMLDLARWRPVSRLPAISRDISIVVNAEDDDETIGDAIRIALADRVDDLESVSVMARTSYGDLPDAARRRLGLGPDQVNALVRIVIRPLSRTLTDDEANVLRDRIYLAVHQGPNKELIAVPAQ
jgi:phenylalanyl-tRNA synthetase alpha chain